MQWLIVCSSLWAMMMNEYSIFIFHASPKDRRSGMLSYRKIPQVLDVGIPLRDTGKSKKCVRGVEMVNPTTDWEGIVIHKDRFCKSVGTIIIQASLPFS